MIHFFKYIKSVKILILGSFCLLAITLQAQEPLSRLLEQYNSHEVLYMSVQELAMPKTNPVILDAREANEFEVSHIKNAIFVGYNSFDLEATTKQLQNKQQSILVYCSLGIRSETIAKKLQNAGYTKVYNLYGGIFEWKNEQLPIFNAEEKETDSIHAFSKAWSKWLHNGTKVYGNGS